MLDLRQSKDFGALRLPNSINLPLETLNSDTCSPFQDSSTLEKQWIELDLLFRDDSARNPLKNHGSIVDHQVLVVCYDGDTSRVATSILRAKNVEAFSVRGGTRVILPRRPKRQNTNPEKTSTRVGFEADTVITPVDNGTIA